MGNGWWFKVEEEEPTKYINCNSIESIEKRESHNVVRMGSGHTHRFKEYELLTIEEVSEDISDDVDEPEETGLDDDWQPTIGRSPRPTRDEIRMGGERIPVRRPIIGRIPLRLSETYGYSRCSNI